MIQAEGRTLEIIAGDLFKGYQQLVVGTFQEASEIMNGRRLEPDRRKREELRERSFHTANLSLARIKDGTLEYELSGRDAFDGIAGQNIGEYVEQVFSPGFYKLTPEQIGALPNFADIEWVDPSKLNLQTSPRDPEWSDKWSFVEVDTSDYFAVKLNDDQRRVAQKTFGSMERKQEQGREYTDFGENMNMLKAARKTVARIFFPNPNYVKESIKEGEVVARGFGLTEFSYYDRNSYFDTFMRSAVHRHWLRGVRDELYPIRVAYKTILSANLDHALRAMTPEIATGLSGLLARYRGNQEKQ